MSWHFIPTFLPYLSEIARHPTKKQKGHPHYYTHFDPTISLLSSRFPFVLDLNIIISSVSSFLENL